MKMELQEVFSEKNRLFECPVSSGQRRKIKRSPEAVSRGSADQALPWEGFFSCSQYSVGVIPVSPRNTLLKYCPSGEYPVSSASRDTLISGI